MSVRLQGADKLVADFGSDLGVGTGIVTLACWARIMSDLNHSQGFVTLGDAASDPTVSVEGAYADSDGTSAAGDTSLGSGTSSGQAMTVGTWYWIVSHRTGGVDFYIRVYADDGSLTKLADVHSTDHGGSLTGLRYMVAGICYTSQGSADAEMQLVKMVVGLEWSDADAQAEGKFLAMQTAGGTHPSVWELEDVDADTHGLNERTGGGPDFSNTGLVAGAGRPTSLEAASGGYTPPVLPFMYLKFNPTP